MYEELVNSLRMCVGEDNRECDCDSCLFKGKIVDGEDYTGCVDAMVIAAADAIEELNRKVVEWQEEACKWNNEYYHLLDNKPRWISVEERLPEDDCNCIVFSNGYVKEAHFYFGKFYDPIEDYMKYNATHWMPLPEPPKEET